MLLQKEVDENPYLYRFEHHKPLRFGTSGLRDEDSKLTDLQVYISAKGFLNYLKSIPIERGGIKPGCKVSLAGDFRPSTPRILFAVSYAVIDSGFEVDFCGRVPTPTVSYYGFINKIPSIMVTASHNPYGQNGVKFVKTNSEVMKDEEKPILDEIHSVREIEYKKSWRESIFNKEGLFKDFEELEDANTRLVFLRAKKPISEQNINHKAKEIYIERYKKIFGKILTGEKFVFYEQTCVGRDIIPKIFEELGAEVVLAGRVDETKEFVSVDTEDMKEHILEKMAELAVINNCFLTISADGDSDRPAVLIVRKDYDGKHKYKNGKPHYYFLKGDKLNVLTSIYIKPDFVVVPASVSHKPIELLKKLGIKVKFTKVGSPYVIKAMNDRKNIEKDDFLVYGFEGNGGGIIGSDKLFFDDVVLSSLPTRDAALPIICTLILAKIRGVFLEDLLKQVFSGEYESHHHSGLIENIPGFSVTEGCERYNSEVGRQLIEAFLPIDKKIIEVEYSNDDVVCFDEDFNKVLVDKENLDRLIKTKDILIKYVRVMIGVYDIKISKINYLDGIRIYLSNSEILHFRPSGNASQFRVYAETKTEERTLEIIERAIRPKFGVVVKLINDYLNGGIKL